MALLLKTNQPFNGLVFPGRFFMRQKMYYHLTKAHWGIEKWDIGDFLILAVSGF